MIGEEEIKEGVISVKNFTTCEQKKMSLEEIIHLQKNTPC